VKRKMAARPCAANTEAYGRDHTWASPCTSAAVTAGARCVNGHAKQNGRTSLCGLLRRGQPFLSSSFRPPAKSARASPPRPAETKAARMLPSRAYGPQRFFGGAQRAPPKSTSASAERKRFSSHTRRYERPELHGQEWVEQDATDRLPVRACDRGQGRGVYQTPPARFIPTIKWRLLSGHA